MRLLAQLTLRKNWFANLSFPFAFLAFLLLSTIPLTLIIALIDIGMRWVAASADLKIFSETQKPAPDLLDLILLYPQVFSIVLIVSILHMIVTMLLPAQQQEPTDQLPPGAKFLSRLPSHLGTQLLYLQMEDHYLRATTKAGSALVLIRFRDALDELEGFEGIQVHRSWWVSQGAIARVNRDGRKWQIVATDGMRIPVSAAHRDAVRSMLD
jgi:hypothetical protein